MEHNFPFGYSGWEFQWTTSQDVPFILENFPAVGQAKIALPLTVQPKFPKMVNTQHLQTAQR